MLRILFLIVLTALVSAEAGAQSHLNKVITVNANKEKLGKVLGSIEKQGHFYFSYSGNTINPDSLVSIRMENRTVRQTLDVLFSGRLEYDETDKHVILKRASQQVWYASGYVYDRTTGEKLSYASVYERRQLVSTMTNENGYYRLKLKDKSQPAQISISKSWYLDTTITVRPASEQELNVSIVPKENEMDTVVITPQVEGSWLSKLFVSSKQRMQSLNMSKFFVNMPVQASITPGLGTHGKMSAQVVNKFSFNLLGGYTAGVNGAEIGGFFNITKHDAKYTQIAGVFNIVGGNVYGTQVGGLYNHVMDSVGGVQIAGLGNTVKGTVEGSQISGFYNYSGKYMHGVQFAGFANLSKKMEGTQISGFSNLGSENVDGLQITAGLNIAAKEMNGVQIGGLFNYAKKLDGVQIGFINFCDTSTGYSLGLINIVNKGYHKFSMSANEVMNVNLAFKTGNTKYYSIIYLGANAGNSEAYSYGYGAGSDIRLAKNFSFTPELSAHYLYLGSFKYANILSRASLNLQFSLGKNFSIFAGPVISVYYSDQDLAFPEYKSSVPGYNTFLLGGNTTSWIGWNAGINLF